MREEILNRLRQAINDDPRTVNAIALLAGIQPTGVYRLVDRGGGITEDTAARLGAVVGLRIEMVCEEVQSSNRSS